MLKNASPIEMKYSVGDIVCFRKGMTQLERPDGVKENAMFAYLVRSPLFSYPLIASDLPMIRKL